MNKAEKFITGTLLKPLNLTPDLQNAVSNSLWLFLDKFIRLGVAFLVSVKITNYLGSSQTGIMNGAISFAVLFFPITSMGLDAIGVRELVKYPDKRNEILGSALVLRLIGGTIALVLGGIIGVWASQSEPSVFYYIILIQLFTFVVMAFEVIDYQYLATSKSKYGFYAKNVAFGVGVCVKLYLLQIDASVIWYVFSLLFDCVFSLILQYSLFAYQKYQPLKWFATKTMMRHLFGASYMMMVSSAVILIYMRIDAFMITKIATASEAGIYTVATRLSEMWYFIPIAITNSVMPNILRALERHGQVAYLSKLQKLFDFMTWLGISVALITPIFAPWAVSIYKPEFAPAVGILQVHIWCGIFVCLGTASTQFFTNGNLLRLTFYKTLAGALCNVLLNFILIPKYGGLGSAYATLISYGIASYFSNLVFKESRPIFMMFLKSLNLYQVILRFKP